MMVICVVGDLKSLRVFYIRTRRYSGRGIGRLGVGVGNFGRTKDSAR